MSYPASNTALIRRRVPSLVGLTLEQISVTEKASRVNNQSLFKELPAELMILLMQFISQPNCTDLTSFCSTNKEACLNESVWNDVFKSLGWQFALDPAAKALDLKTTFSDLCNMGVPPVSKIEPPRWQKYVKTALDSDLVPYETKVDLLAAGSPDQTKKIEYIKNLIGSTTSSVVWPVACAPAGMRPDALVSMIKKWKKDGWYDQDTHEWDPQYQAFFDMDLQTATIPETLQQIDYLPIRCLPPNIRTIPSRALAYSRSLNLHYLPKVLESIGEYAFIECKNLKLTEFPPSLCSVGKYAFKAASHLELSSLPSEMRTIPTGCFQDCEDMTLQKIPDSVTIIEDQAFKNCISLNTVSLPNRMSKIGKASFYGCGALQITSLPYGLTQVEYSAFEQCTSLKELQLPDSLKEIGNSAFRCCSNLKIAELPSAVESVGPSAFEGCIALGSVKLSDSLTTIHDGAFRGCGNLEIDALPLTVGYVAPSAFDGCLKLSGEFRNSLNSVAPLSRKR